jgi:hypothetical protein
VINALVFGLFVLPSLADVPLVEQLAVGSLSKKSVALIGAAVVIGLVFSTLQTPMYQVLEGYVGWPASMFMVGRRRQMRAKQRLHDRIEAIGLMRIESAGELTDDDRGRLRKLHADRWLAGRAVRDRSLTAAQRALLRERLRRFPLENQQVLPSRLGNAIRRLEEYGYDRYRLDSQVFWYELSAVVSDQVRRQVDLARTGVDFFVCLLYGHLLVIVTALAGLTTQKRVGVLALVVVLLLMLVPVWYRLATAATDDWAAAVRALINLARKPFAESVGLKLPDTLAREREMWSLLSKLSRLAYHEGAAALDEYRKD